MSDKGLSVLSKQNLLNEHKEKTINLCEYYVFGKHTKIKFNKNVVYKTRSNLDYIHYDL